jgi:FMN phosphatase YigB (HAD superfamily)
MRAVIFGYFGTLTDPGAEEYREPLAHRTGELLGVCRPRFWEALAGSFGERTIGVHGGTESTLRAVALSCGANPSSAQLPVALAHHRSGHARLRKPRHHALGVLAELRRRGFRIGLLSDCGAELAECWSPTAFVPLVFSWQERCRKPNPRLHAPVARRLAVHPRYRLIIIDEVGYIPFDTDAANLFFQLVASRYEQASILVTSNLPFGRWGEVFGDEVVAAAMIDRLVHHAEVLTLAGDSFRTRARRELLAKNRDK